MATAWAVYGFGWLGFGALHSILATPKAFRD